MISAFYAGGLQRILGHLDCGFLCTFVCVCVYSAAVRRVKLSSNPSENWNHLHFHLTAESNGLDYRPADEMTVTAI